MVQFILNELSGNNMQSPTEFELSSVVSAKQRFWFNEFASCLVNKNLGEVSPISVNLTEMATRGSSMMENQAAAASSSDRATGLLDCKFSNFPIQAVVANKSDFSILRLLDYKISLPVIDHYPNNCGFINNASLLSNGSIDMGNHLLDTTYNTEIPGPDSNGDLFHLVNQAVQVPNLTETSLSDSNSFLGSSHFSDEPCFDLESMLNILDSAPDMVNPNQPYQVPQPIETSLLDSNSSLHDFSFFQEPCLDLESMLNNPDNAPNKFDPNVNVVTSNNLNIDTVPAYSPSLFLDSTKPLMDSQSRAYLSIKNQQYQSHGPNLHGSHLFGSNGCFPVVSHEACIPISTPTSRSDSNSSFGGKSLNINFLSDSATRPLFNSDSSIPWPRLSDLRSTNQFNKNASLTIPGQQYSNVPCAFNVNHQSPQLSIFNFTTQDQQCLNDPSAFNVNDQSPLLLNDSSASNANNELPQLFGSGFTTEIGNPPKPSSVYSFAPGSMFTRQVQQQFIHRSSNYCWLKENDLPKINGHSSREINPKSFVCKTCKMSFPSTHALGGHMSSHTREERKKEKMITKAQSNLSQKDFDVCTNISSQVASFANRKKPDEPMPQVSAMTENSLKVSNGKRKLSLEHRDIGNEEDSSRKIIKLGEAQGSEEEPK